MRIAIAATHGGHLSEAIILLERVIPRCDEVILLTGDAERAKNYLFTSYIYPRNENPFVFLTRGFFYCLKVLRRERPDWVISTGAECGVFGLAAARVLGIRTIFIETVTRLDNPTRAAKLSYRLATRFYVQHPETLECFGPKAEYVGGLV